MRCQLLRGRYFERGREEEIESGRTREKKEDGGRALIIDTSQAFGRRKYKKT